MLAPVMPENLKKFLMHLVLTILNYLGWA